MSNSRDRAATSSIAPCAPSGRLSALNFLIGWIALLLLVADPCSAQTDHSARCLSPFEVPENYVRNCSLALESETDALRRIDILLFRGRAYVQLGETQLAESDFALSAQLAETTQDSLWVGRSHHYAATAWEARGDIDRALSEFRAAAIESEFANAQPRACLLLIRHRDQRARAECETFAAAFPGTYWAHRTLGMLHLGLREYDLARREFQLALELATDDRDRAYASLGIGIALQRSEGAPSGHQEIARAQALLPEIDLSVFDTEAPSS
jgi:tetratricopeptide (TPR) repeat protein